MSQLDEVLSSKPQLVPAVVCFPVKGEDVLLMHRKKTSDGLGQDLVSGIGGKVGDDEAFANESSEQALKREVEEEIGIQVKEFRKVGRVRFLWQTKPKWNMDVLVYIIDSWEGVPQETAVAKPVWHKISNLPEANMWEDNLHWVPKVLAGEEVEAFFLYGEDKKLVEVRFI